MTLNELLLKSIAALAKLGHLTEAEVKSALATPEATAALIAKIEKPVAAKAEEKKEEKAEDENKDGKESKSEGEEKKEDEKSEEKTDEDEEEKKEEDEKESKAIAALETKLRAEFDSKLASALEIAASKKAVEIGAAAGVTLPAKADVAGKTTDQPATGLKGAAKMAAAIKAQGINGCHKI
jgi:hypothetical protein